MGLERPCSSKTIADIAADELFAAGDARPRAIEVQLVRADRPRS
jgi:hypothetical protein